MLARTLDEMRDKLKTSHSELEGKTRELSSLLSVSQILTSTLELPALLDAVVAKAVDIIPGADAGALVLQHADGSSPVVQCAVGLNKESLAHFADHCALCHANDGSGQTPIGKNVNPRALDLRLPDIQSMSDGEIFWVIHNGIRFTAMPAWGEGDPAEDKDSWKLVHFIRHLPQLTTDELDRMKALNPKTKKDLEEEAAFGEFLQGNDAAAAKTDSGHHH
jgi:mono/diheme cytochrome c family protein